MAKKQKCRYHEKSKDVYALCKTFFSYECVKDEIFDKPQQGYNGIYTFVLKKDKSYTRKQRRKMKKLNNSFDDAWEEYDNASSYLSKDHLCFSLPFTYHLLYLITCLLCVFLVVMIYVSGGLNGLGMMIFCGVFAGLPILLYIFEGIKSFRKNRRVKKRIKKATKSKYRCASLIKSILESSPKYNAEESPFDFLDDGSIVLKGQGNNNSNFVDNPARFVSPKKKNKNKKVDEVKITEDIEVTEIVNGEEASSRIINEEVIQVENKEPRIISGDNNIDKFKGKYSPFIEVSDRDDIIHASGNDSYIEVPPSQPFKKEEVSTDPEKDEVIKEEVTEVSQNLQKEVTEESPKEELK